MNSQTPQYKCFILWDFFLLSQHKFEVFQNSFQNSGQIKHNNSTSSKLLLRVRGCIACNSETNLLLGMLGGSDAQYTTMKNWKIIPSNYLWVMYILTKWKHVQGKKRLSPISPMIFSSRLLLNRPIPNQLHHHYLVLPGAPLRPTWKTGFAIFWPESSKNLP